MPGKMQNKDIPILWELAKESMYSVSYDTELFDTLEEGKMMWQFLWNCDIDNRAAIMHWSRDVKTYTDRYSKEYKTGWSDTNVAVMAGHLSRYCMGSASGAYDTEFYTKAQKYKFCKKAPYLFWAPGRKLTAYFVGRDVLQYAHKFGRRFWEHCCANNFPEEVARGAYRNARHLVCTIAALAPTKLKTTDGYKISCALQGKPVVDGRTKMPDDQIEQFREYILLNKSDETLPDIVGIVQGE